MEKYRLQLLRDGRYRFFAISFSHEIARDCFIRAISEKTDVQEHKKRHFQMEDYSEPMTIEEIVKFVSENKLMMGVGINRCAGLLLEDSGESVLNFTEPVSVR